MENQESGQKLDQKIPSHEKIFDILVNQEDITWQTIIYDLVKSEEMDPWDIDVSQLTKKYISIIKEMKKLLLVRSPLYMTSRFCSSQTPTTIKDISDFSWKILRSTERAF